MHKLVLVVSLIVFSKCEANENKLKGTWRMDPQRSLKELNLPIPGNAGLNHAADKVAQVLEWPAKKGCAGIKVVYGDNAYQTVTNGDDVNSVTAPYKIIESGDGYIVIDQPENGGTLKINFIGDSFYVNQTVGGFTYKDYFT